jgi:DNA/RNA-binding domain of Phe-tRNA-synthetase-like protein
MTLIGFVYDPAILEKFPQTVGGLLHVTGIINRTADPDFLAAYQAEQQAVLEKLGQPPLSQIEALAAWRRTLSAFGLDPTQYRSAPEALLRRLQKKGDIPSINLLVDLGNWVSIRYALPIAAVDTRHINGLLRVHFADGAERYTELGTSEVIHPEVGEVVFSDDDGLVFARRWCWRQSAQSASQLDTQAAIITIEAQHPDGRATVEAAMHDLSHLIQHYLPGVEIQQALLDRETPLMSLG